MRTLLVLLLVISLIPFSYAQTPNPDNPSGPVAASSDDSRKKQHDKGFEDGYNGKVEKDLDPDYKKGHAEGERKRAEDDAKEDDDQTDEPEEKGGPPDMPLPYPTPTPPIVTMDGSDPLVVNLKGEACTYKAYPEMDPSRLSTLEWNGENVTLSRILCEGSMYLFVDYNEDGILSNAHELLVHESSVYVNLELLDSNKNGFFDYADEWWNSAKFTDIKSSYELSEFGILGFSTSYTKTFDDMHNNGRYADCLYQDEFYYSYCKPVSEKSGFRIVAYNLEGVITTHGIYPSYGATIGAMSFN